MGRDMLMITSMGVDDDSLWLFESYFNAILKYDIPNKRLEYFTTVSGIADVLLSEYAFSNMQISEDKIVLVPNQSKDIIFINKNNKEKSILQIGRKQYTYGLFRYAYKKNGLLYLIPSEYDSIVVIDVKKECIVKERNWRKIADKYIEDGFIADFSVEGDKISMLISPFGEIITYSINTDKFEVIEIKDKSLKCGSVLLFNGNFFVQDWTKGIYLINPDNSEISITNSEHCLAVSYLYKFGNKIMLDNIYKNKVVIYDENFDIDSIYFEDEIEYSKCVYFVFVEGLSYKEYDLYFDNANSTICYFKGSKLVNEEFVDGNDVKEKMVNALIADKITVVENSRLTERDYIEYLKM